MFKKHQGGLKGRKGKIKVVVQHENSENRSRCFVCLFKLYHSKYPQNRLPNTFYLKLLKNPTEDCWFSSVPIGHTTLAGTIARLCQCAGIPGYKNQSFLMSTAATCLYQDGVDEQLIMEKTGHRSLEGVRSYKRTNMEQQENLSDISATKRHAIQSSSASVLVILPVSLF